MPSPLSALPCPISKHWRVSLVQSDVSQKRLAVHKRDARGPRLPVVQAVVGVGVLWAHKSLEVFHHLGMVGQFWMMRHHCGQEKNRATVPFVVLGQARDG